ncbi:hypothetical protein NDU88_005288, partial [Pleurodeles waltl]
AESKKPNVIHNQIILSTEAIQPYLMSVINPRHRFVLTRLRLDTFHRLVTFPTMNDWSTTLKACPCDAKSLQTTIHVVLFCKLYAKQRKRLVAPLLRLINLPQCRTAYASLQVLSSIEICGTLANFLCSVLSTRKRMGVV